MEQREWLAERFEKHRGRLKAVAYRMLGSPTGADDAVQEAWMRFSRSDTGEVENLGGWLTTVVSRVCLNMLQARRSRPEVALSDELIEPTVAHPGADPEAEALLGDSVGMALMVVLDSLTPPERVAFVLHDVFAVPFEEIAPIVDRSPEAARQLASRAKGAVPALVNGAAGAAWAPRGQVRVVFFFTVEEDRIIGIDLIGDDDHLSEIDLILQAHD